MEYITLNNGVEMPMLGYGVYQVEPAECERCVTDAIEVGYRSIDTAQAYRNEEGVGAAVARCRVPREELFLTTKVWISNAGQERAATSIDESLRKLGTDYLDLLLIHQPFGDYYGTYRAMEAALAAGKVRAIGVSNFYPDRLIDLARFAEVVPAVNQIETHPFHQQRVAHDVMARYDVVHESWGPFAEGRKDMFTHPVIAQIGAAHGKSVAQVILRFLIQSAVVVIPKSSRRERMAENLDVFDFALSEADMQALTQLDEAESAFFSHQDPATVEMLTGYGAPRR
ncbi:aldo/keto reductase [Nostocoides sp.]|jgi:2,5-diketo-D-gluconate reductase A|uniref:aldo/keto reductase n=1 Tax=Nostocoides sp. TaxID=1917966 RepID=UPI002BDE2906|nr:aldo/keto reductase [Tetrasphaera sp.]